VGRLARRIGGDWIAAQPGRAGHGFPLSWIASWPERISIAELQRCRRAQRVVEETMVDVRTMVRGPG
jgi:hypothetical protein